MSQIPNTNIEPTLLSEDLWLRPLERDDLEGLFKAASDPVTWAGHPASDRYKRAVFEPYFAFLLENGGTLAIIDRSKNEIIGCSRYYYPAVTPDSLSIGYTFLSNAYWGGHSNFAVKKLMLNHAFKTVGDVWFHINPQNIRSQKATAKLGAQYVRTESLNLSGQNEAWMLFCLRKVDWQAIVKSKQG